MEKWDVISHVLFEPGTGISGVRMFTVKAQCQSCETEIALKIPADRAMNCEGELRGVITLGEAYLSECKEDMERRAALGMTGLTEWTDYPSPRVDA